MKEILLTLAVLLIIGWGIGFFGFHLGGLFHLILVVALISFVLQLISRRN